MSNLINAIQQGSQANNARTANGAVTNATSFSSCVDLFGLIGASRGKDISNLFDKALSENPEVAIRTAMWGRDVRGGAGERQVFRDLFAYLIEQDYKVAERVLRRIPELGRWDDVLVAIETPLEPEAIEMIRSGLNNPDTAGLVAKWMPRQVRDVETYTGVLTPFKRKKFIAAYKIRKQLGLTPKGWRKMLVALSNTVEQKMCAKQWAEIEYGKLPSKAAAMYQNTFKRHDESRYLSYVEKLTAGEEKINAGAIFPHDVVVSAQRGNDKVATEQWKALPNYMEDSGENVLPMIDVSGSMSMGFAGGSTANFMDVAVALGLYCSERMGGIFKGHYISFSERPVLARVEGTSLARRVQNVKGKHVGYSTNFQAAFDLILDTAIKNGLKQEDLPTMVLALSDMEFNQVERSYGYRSSGSTNFKAIKQKFDRAGYKMPKLVFWNLNGREGNMPVTIHDSGTALVSGFSPAIMKSVLAAKTVTPTDIMLDTVMVDRYNF